MPYTKNPYTGNLISMKATRRTILAAAAAITAMPAASVMAQARRKYQDKELISAAGHKLNFAKFEKLAGFTSGPATAKKTVFVFFDSQCPHCATLWKAHIPLRGEAVNFRWIPVGVISRSSIMQGSTILAADDPVAAMDEHETLMSQRRGGITVSSKAADKYADQVREHTKVLTAAGARSVPFMAYLNDKGEAVSEVGAMQTPVLAAFLGLTPGASVVTVPSARHTPAAPATAK